MSFHPRWASVELWRLHRPAAGKKLLLGLFFVNFSLNSSFQVRVANWMHSCTQPNRPIVLLSSTSSLLCYQKICEKLIVRGTSGGSLIRIGLFSLSNFLSIFQYIYVMFRWIASASGAFPLKQHSGAITNAVPFRQFPLRDPVSEYGSAWGARAMLTIL